MILLKHCFKAAVQPAFSPYPLNEGVGYFIFSADIFLPNLSGLLLI